MFGGQKYPVISYDNNWIRIDLGNRIGYIYYDSNYLRISFTSKDQYFKVVENNVTVYDNSSGVLIPIGTLDKDKIYKIENDYGDWHEIRYARKIGYVWKDATTPMNVGTKIPILTYHNFTDKVSDGANISPQRFREHLLFLKQNGYTTITQEQLINYLNGNGTLPKKPVMITIDDGYLSTYTHAYPILREFNMKATVFVITGMVGGKSGSLEHFNWEQAREMENSGVIDIQSHTHQSHYKFNGKAALSHKLPNETNQMYYNRIYNDLYTAKDLIEQHLNKTVTAIAYPYGSWNETVKQVAEMIGYSSIYLYDEGIGPAFKGQDNLLIDRYGVNGNHTAKDIYHKFLN